MPEVSRIVVGPYVFPSKKALTEKCRTVLYSHAPEHPIEGEDAVFLEHLLKRHKQNRLKEGCGVRYFFVRVQPLYKNKGFWLQRLDDSETDFSFVSCITPPTQRAEVLKGFRTCVQPDVNAFKQRAFRSSTHVPCAATGELVTYDNAHVDHRPPRTFVTLVETFLSGRSLTVEGVPITPTADGNIVTEIADLTLREAFRTFHKQHADLRILSVKANLARVA